jgi:hypothetical protein
MSVGGKGSDIGLGFSWILKWQALPGGNVYILGMVLPASC